MFDRLRRAFDDGYVACHSLQPTRHPYKQFPEIDFAICCAEGLYVLEIKGGRISCQEGVWRYEDGYGNARESQESPFRQAETALWGLLDDLSANLPVTVIDQFTFGYGVVLPDCDWPNDSAAEWDLAMVADRRRSRNIEGWLRSLFGYWSTRGGNKGKADEDAVRQVLEYLRPHRYPRRDVSEESLFHQVTDAGRRICELTADQMRMADVAEANPRTLCAGGAGTGKTFLAEKLARRWTDAGMQVALVCRSPWLRHFLSARVATPRLHVSLIGGVRLDCRRAGLKCFDAVIVDEGQDLFETGCLEILDGILDGGLKSGRWCWFHDLNNQFLSDRFDPCAKSFLESLSPVRMPLRTNCRNTRIILEWIQNELGADLGVGGAGEGPDVRQQAVSDKEEAAVRVAGEIVELVDRGGLTPGSVTILSPFEYTQSSVAAMRPDAVARVCRLDEYSTRNMPANKVGFATIEDFKGLENDAIIVTDLPVPAGDDRSAAHYVAMSRARAVLSLIHMAPSREGRSAKARGKHPATVQDNE